MEIALLTLLIVVLIGAGLGAFAWIHGWSAEGLSRPLRSAATEAAERTADLVADFRDWLRLGR